MADHAGKSKEELIKRLSRIEGQIRGIQRMVQENKHCVDILTQVSAVRAAVNKVGSLILEQHSVACIEDIVSANDKEKALEDLNKTIQSFMKF